MVLSLEPRICRKRIRSVSSGGRHDRIGATLRPEPPFSLSSTLSRRVLASLLACWVLAATSTSTAPTDSFLVEAQEQEEEQPSFHASCFNHLRAADDDGNLLLSRAEFGKFLLTQSGGAVVLFDNPPTIVTDPFTSRLIDSVVDDESMDISSIDSTTTANTTASTFCREVNSGLLEYFELFVPQQSCIDALQAADTNPQNGRLFPAEYPLFITTLIGSLDAAQQLSAGPILDALLTTSALPQPVQDAFDDLTIDGEIRGPRGNEYLMEFCQRVVLAVRIASPAPVPTPTAAPTVVAAPSTLSRTNYTTCQTSLIVSDDNRDDWLQPTEYVTLIVKFSPALATTSASTLEFRSLDPLFQDLFTELSTTGENAISLAGSNPGVTPTAVELTALEHLCTRLYQTAEAYEGNLLLLATAAAPPPLVAADATNSPPAAAPILPTTPLSDAAFAACTTSLIVSDLSRNERLDQTEYVRFVNRLSADVVSSTTFDSLDPLIQQAFTASSSQIDDAIDISGSKPGHTPTAEQTEHLRTVCTNVHAAVAAVESSLESANGTGDGSPTEPPSGDGDGIMPDDFVRLCKTAMLIADLDRDDIMTTEEYVRFLNRLTYSQFSGVAFDDLDPTLQQGFTSVLPTGSSTVDISGSKPGTSASTAETAHLQSVCLAAYTAIEEFNNPVVANTTAPATAPTMVPAILTSAPVAQSTPAPSEAPILNAATRTCVLAMNDADVNLDSALDQGEYLDFLNRYTGSSAKDLTELPYLLQDNFNWLRLGDASVNVQGSTPGAVPLLGDAIRTQWICNRTDAVVEAASTPTGKSSNYVDHCKASLLVADMTMDGEFNEDEFIALINRLTAGIWDGYNMASVEAPLRLVFNESNALNGTTNGANNSSDLCGELQNAIDASRNGVVFFEQCKVALSASDADGNEQLNSTEYVPFLYTLGRVYNLTDTNLEDLSYDVINNGLQLNFEAISLGKDAVDISGMGSATAAAPEKMQHLRWICQSTEDVLDLINTKHNATVTVYNSFVVYSSIGLNAAGFTPQSSGHTELNTAYGEFVKRQVQAAMTTSIPSPKLRGTRRLALDKAVSFAETVYQIDDLECPTDLPNVQSGGSCLTAFGTFYLSVIDMEDAMTLSNSFTGLTQRAIDDGALQSEMLVANPASTVQILQSSVPLRPSNQNPSLEAPNAPSSSREQGSSFGVPLAIGAGLILVGIGFFVYRKRKFEKSHLGSNRPDSGTFPAPDSKNQPVYSFTEEGLIDHNSYGVAPGRNKAHGKSIDRPEQHPSTESTMSEPQLHYMSDQCNILQDSFEGGYSGESDDLRISNPVSVKAPQVEQSDLHRDAPTGATATSHDVMEELQDFLNGMPQVINVDNFDAAFDVESDDGDEAESLPAQKVSVPDFSVADENDTKEQPLLDPTQDSSQVAQRLHDHDDLDSAAFVADGPKAEQAGVGDENARPAFSITSDHTDEPLLGETISSRSSGESPNQNQMSSLVSPKAGNLLDDSARLEQHADETSSSRDSRDSMEEAQRFMAAIPVEASILHDSFVVESDVERDDDEIMDNLTDGPTLPGPDEIERSRSDLTTSAPASPGRRSHNDNSADQETEQTLRVTQPIEDTNVILSPSPAVEREQTDEHCSPSNGKNRIPVAVLEPQSHPAETSPIGLDAFKEMMSSAAEQVQMPPDGDDESLEESTGVEDEKQDNNLEDAESDEEDEDADEGVAAKTESPEKVEESCSSDNSSDVEADEDDDDLEDAESDDDDEEAVDTAAPQPKSPEKVEESCSSDNSSEADDDELVDEAESDDDDDEEEDVDEAAPKLKSPEKADESDSADDEESVASGDGSVASESSTEPSIQEEKDHLQDDSSSCDEADTLINSTASVNSGDLREAYEKYRPIVESLVREVVPDEIDNIDSMMEQFLGRETELIATLRGMAGIDDDEDEDDEDKSKSETMEEDDDESESMEATEEDEASEIEEEATDSEEMEEVVEEEVSEEEVSEEEVSEVEEEVTEEDELEAIEEEEDTSEAEEEEATEEDDEVIEEESTEEEEEDEEEGTAETDDESATGSVEEEESCEDESVESDDESESDED